jgi:hypothetical protein
MLEANNVDAAAKLFAATTLKGKVGGFRLLQRPAPLTTTDCL